MKRPACQSLAVLIQDESAIGHARRSAVGLAGELGLDAALQAKIALVVTEAATNILKHGGQGELVVQRAVSEVPSLEMLALDKGPGMANIAECSRDGFSTGGTRGVGLGSMMRASDFFDIYSQPQNGTALIARWLQPVSRTHRQSTSVLPPQMQSGAVCVALASEELCGDAFSVHNFPDRTVITMIDGLGHGAKAAEAAQIALSIQANCLEQGALEMMQAMHSGLRGTRGAAIAIADIRLSEMRVHFIGVGNISAAVFGDKTQHLTSHNGIVGERVHRFQVFSYDWFEGALLFMHSDGLTTRSNPPQYSGLLMRDPSLIAGVLYRDHSRGRDDVTVLTARQCVPNVQASNA